MPKNTGFFNDGARTQIDPLKIMLEWERLSTDVTDPATLIPEATRQDVFSNAIVRDHIVIEQRRREKALQALSKLIDSANAAAAPAVDVLLKGLAHDEQQKPSVDTEAKADASAQTLSRLTGNVFRAFQAETRQRRKNDKCLRAIIRQEYAAWLKQGLPLETSISVKLPVRFKSVRALTSGKTQS